MAIVRVARQRHNECALVAACLVGGQDYETASDLFQAVHGKPWWPIGDDDDVGHTWSRKTWLQFVREYVCAGFPAAAMFRGRSRSGASLGPTPDTRFVVIRNDEGRHVMAYADGVVHDGATGAMGPLEEVMASYPGWRVEAYLALDPGAAP